MSISIAGTQTIKVRASGLKDRGDDLYKKKTNNGLVQST